MMQASVERRTIQIVAGALLLTVASQAFYVIVVSNAGPDTPLRPLTWFTELAAFVIIAVCSHSLAVQRPDTATMWSAVALSGLLNALQVAIGLSMFKPAMDAGAGQQQLFATVLAGAFFLYFLAKLMLGFVALALAAVVVRRGGGLVRAAGGLAALAGAAAIILNLMAMTDSKSWTFAAGAAGTAATALLGLLLLLRLGDPAARA